MPRGRPYPIGEVLSELLARRGFGRVRGSQALAEAWGTAAGDLAAGLTRPGQVRGGVLDVLVANSTLVQELSFRKAELLADLARLLPDECIKSLRFRVGRVE